MRCRPQCRVVHGGGRSALAKNRPTDVVGNSSQTLRISLNRPEIVQKNRISYPHKVAFVPLSAATALGRFNQAEDAFLRTILSLFTGCLLESIALRYPT